MLTGLGMRHGEEIDGDDAARLLQSAAAANDPFEAVLIDWIRPTEKSMKASRLQNVASGGAPVIIMASVPDMDEFTAQAHASGIKHVVAKPVSRTLLLQTIQEAVQSKIAARCPQAQRKSAFPACARGSKPACAAGRRQ